MRPHLCPAWLALLFCAMLVPQHAMAHPHVFVTAESEVLYAPDGSITGLRHSWAFDEAYSAFAVQGLDKNNDGKLTPDELADLAKVNIESLQDFGFFTTAKANGKKQAFSQPVDYGLVFDNKVLTLTFTLPLAAPVPSPKSFGLEVFDDTYFVSFGWGKSETAVRLNAPPKGCVVTIARAKAEDTSQPPKLTEEFFATPQAQNIGAQFANKALVACP